MKITLQYALFFLFASAVIFACGQASHNPDTTSGNDKDRGKTNGIIIQNGTTAPVGD
jgi:hypothetical protein